MFLAGATSIVRHCTALGIDFRNCSVGKSERDYGPEFGIQNRRMRQRQSEQSLRFYQMLQKELLDPDNGNQIQRFAPERITPTRTSNVHECQGDTEHATNGEGPRYLSKASFEAKEN